MNLKMKVAVGLCALVALLALVSQANADVDLRPLAAYGETPWQCDAVPKYYCTTVGYDFSGGTVTILDRYFRGGIDGGAKKWRIEYYKDFYWSGGSPVFSRGYGSGSWRTDYYLSQWFSYPEDNVLSSPVSLLALLAYEEWTQQEGWYTWYSPVMQHDIN